MSAAPIDVERYHSSRRARYRAVFAVGFAWGALCGAALVFLLR